MPNYMIIASGINDDCDNLQVLDYDIEADNINEAMVTFTKHGEELLHTFENFKFFETVEVFPENNLNTLET